MTEVVYKISFTTGGLFYREAVRIAELYLQSTDWSLVQVGDTREEFAQNKNANRVNKNNKGIDPKVTSTNICSIVNFHNKTASKIKYYCLRFCKQYLFVQEFAVEVVREKYLRLDLQLTYQDFDTFFNLKAEWNEKLDHIKDSTRKNYVKCFFAF